MGPNQPKLPAGPQQNMSVNELDQANFPSTTTEMSDTTLADTFAILGKRKWLLIVAVLLGLGYGYNQARNAPKPYIATGRIQVRPGASNEFRVSSFSSSDDDFTRLQTEVAILRSDSLMLTVARELHLQDDPVFLQATGPVTHRNLDDPGVRQQVVGQLKGGLGVKLVTNTDIIEISYSSLSPKLSATVVNTVINDYIQRSFQTRFASTQRVSEWLSSQLDDLKQQVETSQEQVMDMQKRLGVLGFDTSKSQISSQLEDLTRAASEARIQRIVAEARYRILSASDPNSANFADNTTSNPALASLRGQQAQSATEFAQLTALYGPNYPLVKQARARLNEIEKAIEAEQARSINLAKQTYTAARTNEDMVNSALEGQKNDAYNLRDDLVQYTIRQREFDSNRTLYEGLLQRLRAAGIQAGLESSEIDIVDIAMLPATPSVAPARTAIITSTVFALILAISLAFLLESLDTGLRSIAEIEALTELPSLAIIPTARRSREREGQEALSPAMRNITVLREPKSPFSEAFRALRTSLLLSTAGHPPKIILVSSATPAEGKTTTATNIACVLAQRDAKVLLMDADLRRPTVHHRFGLTGKIGVSTVLTGATTLEAALQRTPELPNLDVLAAGPVPPFPTEMLSSEAMSSLLERCTHLYTHIIIDSPPILSVTDGVILARLSDAVAMVIRHGKTNKNVVRRCRDLLVRAGAPVTGIVVNAVDLKSPDYFSYYGSRNYSYYGVDSTGWEPSSTARKTRLPNPNEE